MRRTSRQGRQYWERFRESGQCAHLLRTGHQTADCKQYGRAGGPLISAFYKGRKAFDLGPEELIAEILLPRKVPQYYVYQKVGARAASAISRLSFAGL